MKQLTYLLIGVALALGIGAYYKSQTDDRPQVFAGVIIEEFDAMVPLHLSTIEKWDYPKQKIAMEVHLVTGNDPVREQLDAWVKKNRSAYRSLELIDDRPMVANAGSRTDVNRALALVKDTLMAVSKERQCDYCFITSSDTLLRPYTLSFLVEKKKPIIAPMLFPVPKPGDPYRNFFAATNDNGYYKDDPLYSPIASRRITGTFALPCVHKAYLIDTQHLDKLSFSKNFSDWEFIAFSKNARNSNTQQYLTNEREFGVFLLFDGSVAANERQKYSLTDSPLSQEYIQKAIDAYAKEDPALLRAANAFAKEERPAFKLPNGGRLAVSDINEAISKYYLIQGHDSEKHIAHQYEKYVKPGSEAVIIGSRDDADTIALSRIVGEKGRVHAFEPSESAFILQAINNRLNGIENVSLKKTNDKEARIDDLPLSNLSFILIGTNERAIAAVRDGLQAIKKHKPVLMTTLAEDEANKGAIEEIRALGYTYTPIGDDLYLFFPLEMAGLGKESNTGSYKLPPLAALLDSAAYDPTASHPTVKVTWDGTFLDFTSLSHVNRALSSAVLKYPSIDITPIGPNYNRTDISKFDELKEMTLRMREKAPDDTEITVRLKWPPKWEKPEKGKWVLIQFWEFGVLPEDWVKGMKNVDEIWVPTNYVKQICADSGVDMDKVFVVPCGINPSTFHEGLDPYPLPTKKKFKFLFLGGTVHRKGADILLRSYLQSFDASDDVCLVIKDFGTKNAYANMTSGDWIMEAQKMPGAPEIVYMEDDMDIEDIARVYAACDCLVYPYRGEGFALPVLEAMACGLPVMVSAGGATDDFVNESFGWMIPAKRVSMGNMMISFKLAGDGWVLDPDSEILSGMMRWVSEHPELAKTKGANAAKFAKEYMTWDRMAPLAVERLEALKEK